jgi:hypothetical protein
VPSKILFVRADLDARQQRERAVVELHHDTLEREGRPIPEQTQFDRAVGAEQRSAARRNNRLPIWPAAP